LPAEAIQAFEQALYQYAEGRAGQVLAEIREKRELSDAIRQQLDEVIRGAKAEFTAARGIKAA
jgi:F0F1-type ATP synthase alpha subunit